MQTHVGTALLLQSLLVHTNVNCFVLEVLVFWVSSGPYLLSASFFLLFPKIWKEGFDGDLPFRDECSKVSHFEHSVWLWSLCLFISTARKSFSEEMVVSKALIWIQQNIIRSSIIATLLIVLFVLFYTSSI